MLQYLVILLDDTSVSYCHYDNRKSEHRLISLENLKAGILFAMKENLMLQFVYPHYELPQAYKDEIETIDHSKIVPVKFVPIVIIGSNTRFMHFANSRTTLINRICKMHKARVRANNYYWNKLYRKLESEDECDRSGTGKNESNDINS